MNPLCAEYAPAAYMRMRGIAIGKVLQGRGVPQVIVANSGAQILLLDGNDDQTVRSHIHVLTTNAAGTGLASVPISSVPVAGPGTPDDFIGYGACGLAILDLPTTPPISKAIVVTTMNGELPCSRRPMGSSTPRRCSAGSSRARSAPSGLAA